MDPLRTVVRRFDDWLSRVEGVHPFSDDPRIILRIQEAGVSHHVSLPAGCIAAGTPALMLHFWNERLPVIGAQGASLQWALHFQRELIYSFQAVARCVQQSEDLKEIQAVGGVVAHIHTDVPDGGSQLLARLGFTILPYHRPAGAFGEFWENFYTWVLIWTYNPGSLRSHALFSLQRNEFWATRQRFLARFGER